MKSLVEFDFSRVKSQVIKVCENRGKGVITFMYISPLDAM